MKAGSGKFACISGVIEEAFEIRGTRAWQNMIQLASKTSAVSTRNISAVKRKQMKRNRFNS